MKDQITPTALFPITTSGQTHVLKEFISHQQKKNMRMIILVLRSTFIIYSVRKAYVTSCHFHGTMAADNFLVLCYICAFLGLNANGGPLQRNCGCCDFPGLGQITLRYRLYQAFIVVSLSSG